ncbi:hypothetical protein [Pararhodobacter oceanensis]|uniref:Fungal lipase-like domain-containing protein n=1 Tax=Pararhodobacter oceanensis TaxID=2172121 RepID=A0A2T8HXC4_9RHOB|nr:hypothetical protein [Pararhodobacter oceanensis]PVH30079.1 hypothetical protein DDE20_00445 [Pararhodobacter oceanensis]
MSGQAQTEVRKRRVFYIPGFDPFPPRRYRELYRKEGAAQAEISGYALSLSPQPPGAESYGWHVQSQIDGHESEAHITVLVWADIVQASMQRGVLGAYWLMLRSLWIFGSTGALWAMIRLRPGPMLAGAWPVSILTGQLLVALLLAWLIGWGVAALWPLAGGTALGWAVGAAVVYAILRLFQRFDAKLYAYYLLYDFSHTAAYYGDYGAPLTARLSIFAAQIREALNEGADEVLVVGHSSGAALAVSVVAEVLAQDLPEGAPPLALLTLGEAIPMQSFLPRATRLRGDLRALSDSDVITWVDVTAKGDGCCFNLCDPVAVSGVASAQQRWPLVLSAAFSLSLQPETWARLRRRFFKLHFQYLAAFDAPRDYDYFQITAGPKTLKTRYAGRAHSPSRITRARSPHRDLPPVAERG